MKDDDGRWKGQTGVGQSLGRREQTSNKHTCLQILRASRVAPNDALDVDRGHTLVILKCNGTHFAISLALQLIKTNNKHEKVGLHFAAIKHTNKPAHTEAGKDARTACRTPNFKAISCASTHTTTDSTPHTSNKTTSNVQQSLCVSVCV